MTEDTGVSCTHYRQDPERGLVIDVVIPSIELAGVSPISGDWRVEFFDGTNWVSQGRTYPIRANITELRSNLVMSVDHHPSADMKEVSYRLVMTNRLGTTRGRTGYDAVMTVREI